MEAAMDLKTMLGEINACMNVAVVCGVPAAELPDLLQHARIALWRAVRAGRDLDTRDKVRAWFTVVGRCLAANWRRISRRLPSLLEADELADIAGVAPGAEDLLVGRTARARLEDALDELAAKRPKQYAVVEAHDLGEQSMHEVAAALGVGVNTAWDRWRRGWVFLRASVARAEVCEGHPKQRRRRQ
jgi:RNA polymerase sigma factor (sigma-70 family)